MRRGARGLLVLLTLSTVACRGTRPQIEDASADQQAACVGPNPAHSCASASHPCVPTGCGCSFGVWTCTGDCRSDVDCTDGGSDSRDASADAAADLLPPTSDAAFDSARGAALCRDTGGAVLMISCCLGSGEFPETCGTASCNCTSSTFRDVLGCACPGVGCFNRDRGCIVEPCTPGLDQSCNGDPFSSKIQGHCLPDRTCVCGDGHKLDPAIGRCRAGE